MKLEATTINIGFRFHFLKTVEPYFTEVSYGFKNFEVRKNDRDYQAGDHVELQAFDPIHNKKTGETVIKRIVYVMDNPEYVKEGFVILGLGEPLGPFDGLMSAEGLKGVTFNDH